MRIISGNLKRKTIKSVPGLATRPTSDRLRESLFNIISCRVKDARVLDLFAGTGALGLEALSRGARSCVFVDHQKKALDVIRKNIEACALQEKSMVLNRDISRNLNGIRSRSFCFDLVFMDPPYGCDLIPKALISLAETGCLGQGAMIICEHAENDVIEPLPASFTMTDYRSYGKTRVSFLGHPGQNVSV